MFILLIIPTENLGMLDFIKQPDKIHRFLSIKINALTTLSKIIQKDPFNGPCQIIHAGYYPLEHQFHSTCWNENSGKKPTEHYDWQKLHNTIESTQQNTENFGVLATRL